MDALLSPACPWEPGATDGWRRLQVDRALAEAFNHGHALGGLEQRLGTVVRALGGYRDDLSEQLPYFVVPASTLSRLARRDV